MPTWVRRALLASTAALSAGGLGYVLGRASVSVGSVDRPRPLGEVSGPFPAPAVTGCADVEREIAEAREALAVARRQLDDYRAESEGVPIAWGPDIEARYRPETFRQVADEIGTSCPEVQLVMTDCGEPPCMAALTSTAPNVLRALDACSEWDAVYGRYNAVPVNIECDGARVKGWTISAGSAEDLGLVQPEDEANLKKRMRARGEEIRRSWPCPDPPPPADPEPGARPAAEPDPSEVGSR